MSYVTQSDRSGDHSWSGRRRMPPLLAVGALTAADLLVKAMVSAELAIGQVINLGVLTIRLTYNAGVAFSLGANLPTWTITTITGVIIAGLIWYLVTRVQKRTPLFRTGGILLLGGAIGNFIDRLDGHGVVDYLQTGWFPTFNLADLFIVTGVTVLVSDTLSFRKVREVVARYETINT